MFHRKINKIELCICNLGHAGEDMSYRLDAKYPSLFDTQFTYDYLLLLFLEVTY